MGMGTMFTFMFLQQREPGDGGGPTLDLMVQRAYAVMNNDVLISCLCSFSWLPGRARQPDRKLFKSLHLATAAIPGSLAVATVVTCAVFATATGIIGAVVTLDGSARVSGDAQGRIQHPAGGRRRHRGRTLGILIPPSVLLILYGATAACRWCSSMPARFSPASCWRRSTSSGSSSTENQAGIAPPLSAEDRRVDLPRFAEIISRTSRNVITGLIGALKGQRNADVRCAP